MNSKNTNTDLKRKYSGEVSYSNYGKNILNDSLQKKAKKMKETHDVIFKYNDVVTSDMKSLRKESFNKSQNPSIQLVKKRKQNKLKSIKLDKDLSQNETKFNSHSEKNSILNSIIVNKSKNVMVSDKSLPKECVVSSDKNTKLDTHNFKDSVNSSSLKRKKKKKFKNINNSQQQNKPYATIINDGDQPKLNKLLKGLGKNKEINDYSIGKDAAGFVEDLKMDCKEGLSVKSKLKKKKNRKKKILQNQMPLTSYDLTSYQENNFKKSHKEDERESYNSVKALSNKKSTFFQNKAYEKLKAAKFRYLNEMLYTSTGKNALKYFQQNVDEFLDYHTGYQLQVSKWPLNPVDFIIKELQQMSKQSVIVDLGCGEAKIAQVLSNRIVYSFDLIPLKDCVTACDISKVPLSDKSADVAIFCLSLMGTNWKDYLLEAHRILKLGGALKIAEIESRIENLNGFIKYIECYGFALVNKNLSHKMFIFLNFKKVKKNSKSSKVKNVILKPCLYKKR